MEEIVQNAEETFTQQFFNFKRKSPQYVVQMPSPKINLDLGATVQQPFAPSSVGSAPNRNKDKYAIDDIKDPIPYTLILHGRPITAECAVVEVTKN
jgi:hypothetical protein